MDGPGKVRNSRCWPHSGKVEDCGNLLLINVKFNRGEIAPAGDVKVQESHEVGSCQADVGKELTKVL